MCARSGSLLALLLLPACHSAVDLTPASSNSKLHSAILVFEPENDVLQAWAVELTNGQLPRFVGFADARLTALFYERSLAQQLIAPGRLALTTNPTGARKLPVHDEAYVQGFAGAEPTGWTKLDALGPPITDQYIPEVSFDQCNQAGGCFVGPDQVGACEQPCPGPRSFEVAPPAAPQMGPCPAGWSELALEGDGVECEPPPDRRCGAQRVQWPGSASCEALDADCVMGATFPDGLPASGVVYVRAGAPAGGNGTRASPYNLLGSALSSTSAPSVIALGPGNYNTNQTISRSLSVWGTCPTATTLGGRWTIAGGADVTIRGLGMVGTAANRLAQITVQSRGALHLENVRTDLRASGTDLSPRAIDVAAGAHLSMSHVVLRLVGPGIRVFGRATLTDVAAHGGYPVIKAGAGGSLVIQRFVSRSSTVAVGCTGAAATASVSDAVVERYFAVALQAAGEAKMVVDGVVVRDALATSIQNKAALEITGGASLIASRVKAERYFAAGVWVGALTLCNPALPESAVLSDLILRDGTRGGNQASFGIMSYGALSAERVLIERDTDHGLWHAAAQAHVSDLSVHDITRCTGQGGSSIAFRCGAAVTLDRAYARGGPEEGLYLADGSELTANDVRIEGARIGLLLAYDTASEVELTLNRAQVLDSQQTGLTLKGGRMTARDFQISRTEAVDDETCPGTKGLRRASLSAYLLTDLTLDGFELSDSPLGVIVDEVNGLTATDGVIRNNDVGMAVPLLFDERRLSKVRFIDNGTDLQRP